MTLNDNIKKEQKTQEIRSYFPVIKEVKASTDVTGKNSCVVHYRPSWDWTPLLKGQVLQSCREQGRNCNSALG